MYGCIYVYIYIYMVYMNNLHLSASPRIITIIKLLALIETTIIMRRENDKRSIRKGNVDLRTKSGNMSARRIMPVP